jgi:hypothetical protein
LVSATGWTLTALVQAGRPAPADPLRAVLDLAAAGLGAAVVLTLGAALMTILPRRGEDQASGRRADDPLTFGAIAGRSEDAYCHIVARLEPEALGDALARDVWRVARVCRRKYAWVGRTVWASALTVLFALAVLLTLCQLSPRDTSSGRPVAAATAE